MELNDIAFFMLVVIILAMIWQNISAKERATYWVKKELTRLELSLLDDTVAWKGWQREGYQWWRMYEFEFTSTAEERYCGTLQTAAGKAPRLLLPPYRLTRPTHEPLH